MDDKSKYLARLSEAAHKHKPIIGAAVGCGMFAQYAFMGGADLILVLNAGRFRLMGISSTASLLPFGSSNDMVMNIGTSEVLRSVSPEVPCIFGLCATDPALRLDEFLAEIKQAGFAGITNYPTIGLIDGQFREALEESGIRFEREVEAIREAGKLGLLTIAFVFNEQEARLMNEAGADIICAHLGFTTGGRTGVQHSVSLEDSIELVRGMFGSLQVKGGLPLKLVYGGPVNSPENAEYVYRNTEAVGYIGGSSFERIPTEESIVRVTELFKQYEEIKTENEHLKRQLDLHEAIQRSDYIGYITQYVTEHLANPGTFAELADTLHLNRNYLSYLFRKKTGISYSDWLIRLRIKTAQEALLEPSCTVQEASVQVGYEDASYFSRLFKKETGMTPSDWKRQHSSE
ncbi:phosphoenolpyruvate hydrolase family protein [Paenibacillus tuaregi]|uniref:phosphoenolpyruvate hydrolase family protein n=1 Tax=Paenibacillus tuaregi TaxID=1816681 RepID=UPI0008387CC3|nr:phosphoenolpyruvate hydrolase family protein [Paenibacillus tuaregi]